MTTRSNSPYVPSFIKSILSNARPVYSSYDDFGGSQTNHGDSGSFKYDPFGEPLKNTQQLNVDWSKFENHTFFSSAEVKVNETFSRIINGYPFDGSKREVESFFEKLTGFEKWVFDRFPDWSGALHFSGTQAGETSGGTLIGVVDKSGHTFPGLSKNDAGETIMNPSEGKSMSIEMNIRLPEESNGNQIILQKASSESDGFTLALSSSASVVSASLIFALSSGPYRNSVSCSIDKGEFTHLCFALNQNDGEGRLQAYVGSTLSAQSSKSVIVPKMSIDNADLLIGSGSSFYVDSMYFVPTQTLSGVMDELRIFHDFRSPSLQKVYESRGLYSTSSLKLYYRFNEPAGSLSATSNSAQSAIVLDSSGNSLHSYVRNFDDSLRVDVTSYDDNLMINESHDHKVVLFPTYEQVTSLNVELLASASQYDRANPNMITRLIPKHYLEEGAAKDGLVDIDGTIGEKLTGAGPPGSAKLGSTQIILTFLFIWAKFFDEIKTYIDSFSTLRTVGYETYDSIPDNFLNDLIRQSGFNIPTFFNHATPSQFAEGRAVVGLNDSSTPLKAIQTITAATQKQLITVPECCRQFPVNLRGLSAIQPDRHAIAPTSKHDVMPRSRRQLRTTSQQSVRRIAVKQNQPAIMPRSLIIAPDPQMIASRLRITRRTP